MEDSARADALCQEANHLRGEMTAFASIWQDCADHALPLRRLGFNMSGSAPKADPRLQSDVAVDALSTLASGMVSWVTPSQQNWFQWEASEGEAEGGDDPVNVWLADCTRRAHKALANSNFYHAAHLCNLELGAFGTVGLYAEAGRNRPLNFRSWHCGSFACAENDQGEVDRVFRFFNLTAQQAVTRFGEAAPEQCRKDVAANKRHTSHPFIHAIYPRDRTDRNPDGGPMGMPIASCYLHQASKRIVREDGHDSLPVMVSRWLKWSEDSPYGASPAMMYIADIRGSNYLESLLAAMANLKVNPRVITKTGAVGVVDLGPGGITQVSDMNDAPQVWADSSDYRVGLDLVDRVDKRIRRAFHVPLFEQFASIERQITAAEVRARQGEQLARISPAFTLLTTDLINPLLERVFMILFQGGHFLPPPREAFVQDAAGQWKLLYPKTIQISRMSQAIEAQKEHAFASTVETFLPFLQAQPELLDEWDLPVAMRDVARGKGVPNKYLRKTEEVAALQQARAEAQQAAQQQAMALEVATKQPELAKEAAAAMAGGQAA
jgi:Bacteriophage head to tail connecting protein